MESLERKGNPISGACIFRALRRICNVQNWLKFHFSNHIHHDEFYSKTSREIRFEEILKTNKLEEILTIEKIEKAIEIEVTKRDKTPPPRNPNKKRETEIEHPYIYFPFYCFHKETPTCGAVSGKAFERFFRVYLTPMHFLKLLDCCAVATFCNYEPREQLDLFYRAAHELQLPGVNAQMICHAFQHFLEVPDVKAILGNEFPLMDEHKWSLNLHMHCSKVDRIRNEIVIVSNEKNTPSFVLKFLLVVLERVLSDHRQYESAYFDNRKMAIKDRMEQLPTSTKAKGKAKPTAHFIIFGADKSYQINNEIIQQKYPFLFQWIQIPIGEVFQKELLQFFEETFPEKPAETPCKSALVYMEKFIRWASETLEFEKTLTYSHRMIYGYMERPMDHHIPLRVIQKNECGSNVCFVFLDEIRHALRRYRMIFKQAVFDIPPPFVPGPIPMVHEYVNLNVIEMNLRLVTANHIDYEIEFVDQMFPIQVCHPFQGPFNRHVVLASEFLDSMIETLICDVKVCFSIHPSHPKIQNFVAQLMKLCPNNRNSYCVDLDAKLEMENQALLLLKMNGSNQNVKSVLDFTNVDRVSRFLLAPHYSEDVVNKMVPRILFVTAFPQFGELVHRFYCTSDFCYKLHLKSFSPCFGPPTRLQKGKTPQCACYASADRCYSFSQLAEIFQ